MNVILTNYNYYPFAWGGSEVYVHGLAKYLQNLGHQVAIITAVDSSQINNKLKLDKDILQAFEYDYEGVKILGVSLNHETTEEIYSKYNPQWSEAWLEVIQKSSIFTQKIDIIHYNGHTGVISVAIIEALRKYENINSFLPAKVIASYHTPISCPNGKLLYFKNAECQIKPNITTCTACFIQEQTNIPIFVAKLLANFLPNLLPDTNISNSFKVKIFVQLSLNSFKNLDSYVDSWLVMSDYIKTVVLNAGISLQKVIMLRHGIHENFVHPIQKSIDNRENISCTKFVYLGRFEQTKGFVNLLKSWIKLTENPQKRILQIIGETQSSNKHIDTLIKKAKKRNDIIFLGRKKTTEIGQTLRESHCMIIPSEWIEIGPLVFHEAIACGTNIIASNMGGTNELANYYQTGCQTFEMKNSKDLIDKILNFKFVAINHKVRSQKEHYSLVLEQYEQLTTDKL